jgi:hypothetical protein
VSIKVHDPTRIPFLGGLSRIEGSRESHVVAYSDMSEWPFKGHVLARFSFIGCSGKVEGSRESHASIIFYTIGS